MNFRTLDLNLLRVFDEVMSERSLTRAARALSMTQPAVSNALRRLREAVGDELFTRARYGIEPTPVALALWPAVRQALDTLRQAMAPTDFDPATARTSFVLAMADATAALLMPGLLRHIETEAPGVSLRVLPLTTRDPRPHLERHEIDMAVGYFPVAMAAITLREMQHEEPPTVGHERLYEGEYVCVMRNDHPLARRALTLDAYCDARHLLVSFSGRAFGFVDEALAAVKRSRRVVLTVNQFFTAGRVVAQSDLLTVLPRHFLESTGMAHALAVRPLPFAVPRVHVDMLWHSRQRIRPAHAWLRRMVRSSAGEAFERTGDRAAGAS